MRNFGAYISKQVEPINRSTKGRTIWANQTLIKCSPLQRPLATITNQGTGRDKKASLWINKVNNNDDDNDGDDNDNNQSLVPTMFGSTYNNNNSNSSTNNHNNHP